jgi:hypothetical protein
MWDIIRHAQCLAVLATLLSWCSLASAWVETSVRSHVVTVDVDRKGQAVVSHELMLRVRGGPLRDYRIDGVDSDAEPLPDATVSRAESGNAGAAPVPLLLERQDDGALRLAIDHDKGLRRGQYLLRFSYRSDLLGRGLIQPRGGLVELRWVGPRLSDGIDSAKVVFRLPPSRTPPRVPDAAPPSADEATTTFVGVFLSNLRRAADKDELEVIRPHVARGEPVVWRIVASARAFDEYAPPIPNAAAPELSESSAPAGHRLAWLGGSVLVLLLFASLVTLKGRFVEAACRLRGAEPRPLVPLPLALRAIAASGALCGALALAIAAERPTEAAGLILVAMALAVHLGPRVRPRLRGPGRWLPLSDEEAFGKNRETLPGRWLDATTLPGALSLLVLGGAIAVAAGWLARSSVYHALLVGLGGAPTLAVFFTGRVASQPPDPAQRPRRVLRWLKKRLEGDGLCRVTAWARIADGRIAPDELRLLILPRSARPGLVGIEVAFEYQCGIGAPALLPCLLVRAREGSQCHMSLPRNVVWSRGRTPEERVGMLHPALPTRRHCLSLLRRLLVLVTQSPSGSQSRRTARSDGRGSSTAKPARVPSLAHAA